MFLRASKIIIMQKPVTPGMWPSKFHTDIGNGLPLLQEKSVYGPERNLVCVRYRQHLGVARVEIYND